MLPSSNGGADGAIGVCSLNLLGGVSGMRFGVLPSDMVLQCTARTRRRRVTNAGQCRVDGARLSLCVVCGAEAAQASRLQIVSEIR